MKTESLTVAVVDDDEIFQVIAKKMFSICAPQHSIKMYNNGKEILKYLTLHARDPEQLPDIILLDINMPIMDGWMFMAAYEQLKNELTKAVKIYLVSSSIDPKDISRAKLNPNVVEYVIKPIPIAFIKRIASS
jgi:CheY-like chemotaxis protein